MEAGVIIRIVGLILTLIGIVVAIAVYRWSRATRHLDHEFIVKAQLIMPGQAGFSGLQLLYHDEVVEDPHVFVVRLINTGNQPIQPEEQHEPVAIDFGEGVRVLAAEVIKWHPESLSMNLYIDGQRVTLDRTLLNPNDWLAIKILTNKDGDMNVRGRIAGVTEFRTFEAPSKGTFLGESFFWWLVIGLLLSALVFFFDLPTLPLPVSLLIYVAVVTIAAIFPHMFEQRAKKRADALKVTF